MMELRDRIARLIGEEMPASERHQGTHHRVAAAILEIDEIKLGLEALERERESDRMIGHSIGIRK